RSFVGLCAALGLNRHGFPAALWKASRQTPAALAQATQAPGKIIKEMLIAAETMIGLEFTDTKRDMMLAGLNSALDGYAALRKVPLPNPVLPALRFDPV